MPNKWDATFTNMTLNVPYFFNTLAPRWSNEVVPEKRHLNTTCMYVRFRDE